MRSHWLSPTETPDRLDGMPPSPDPIIGALQRIQDRATRIRELRAELEQAQLDLAEEIRASGDLPIQAMTVAAVAGLSRSRVFQLRRGEGPRRPNDGHDGRLDGRPGHTR